MNAFLALLVAAVLLLSSAPGRTQDGNGELLTLAWCLERARTASPAIERAAATAAAAAERVGPAGALEDPRLSYEASNVPVGELDFASTPLSGHQLGLRQKLPFPGLLRSRRRAAERAAESSELLVEDRERRTAGAVEVAWSELGFAQRALAITGRNIELLRQLAATTEARYRVGSGLQQDVLRAQVELTALLQEELRRTQAVAVAEARLVELLDLPGEAAFGRTGPLRLDAPEPSLEAILGGLDESSARLRAATEAVLAAEARVRVAEVEGYPDVDLGVGYRVRRDVVGDPVDGEDFLSAGFTIRLPVDRSKWRSRVAERRSLVRRAKAEQRAVRAELVARTKRAHAQLVRASSEEVLLGTGLVPQAMQSLAASRSAYEVGRIAFLDVLDSQVRLLEAELRLVRASADKRIAFASLEAAAGRTLR